MLRKLIKEIKGLNPLFESSVIRGEIERYLSFWYFVVIIFRGCIPLLQTKSEEDSSKRKGLLDKASAV